MQLVSFSVKNYRSITTAYKLPVKQSTILIGPNNEGKSNILRALVTSLEVLGTFGGKRIFGGRLRSYDFEGRESYQWLNDYPISLQERQLNGESVFDLEFRLAPQEIDEFYTEVGSNLNGTLPIQLSLGRKDPGFRVVKKGPGWSGALEEGGSDSQLRCEANQYQLHSCCANRGGRRGDCEQDGRASAVSSRKGARLSKRIVRGLETAATSTR